MKSGYRLCESGKFLNKGCREGIDALFTWALSSLPNNEIRVDASGTRAIGKFFGRALRIKTANGLDSDRIQGFCGVVNRNSPRTLEPLPTVRQAHQEWPPVSPLRPSRERCGESDQALRLNWASKSI